MNKYKINGLLYLISHILFLITSYKYIIDSFFEFFIILLIPITIMLSVMYFIKLSIPHKKEQQIILEIPKNQWGK